MVTTYGEAGIILRVAIALGGYVSGTSIVDGVLSARNPDTGELETWDCTVDGSYTTATRVRLLHTVPAQLAAGRWVVRPFLYTAGPTLVTSIEVPDQVFVVERSNAPLDA